jgi:hypothetical protein
LYIDSSSDLKEGVTPYSCKIIENVSSRALFSQFANSAPPPLAEGVPRRVNASTNPAY